VTIEAAYLRAKRRVDEDGEHWLIEVMQWADIVRFYVG
jgi:hypothetical protein